MKKIYMMILTIAMLTIAANAGEEKTKPSKAYKIYETAVHDCPFDKFFGLLQIRQQGFDVHDQTRLYVYVNYYADLKKHDEIYRINSVTGSCSKMIEFSASLTYDTSPIWDVFKIDEKRKFIYLLSGKNGSKQINQYNFKGKLIRHLPNKVSSGKINPIDMELDSAGNIYVLDKVSSFIHKFSSSGKHLLTWGGKGSFDGRFSSPEDMAIDKNNMIYVADSGNRRVQKFNSSGSFITKWGKNSVNGVKPDIYEFPRLNFVAVDNKSHVYAGDRTSADHQHPYGSTRIKKFYSNGD